VFLYMARRLSAAVTFARMESDAVAIPFATAYVWVYELYLLQQTHPWYHDCPDDTERILVNRWQVGYGCSE
jgi:hypothetical protein